MSYPVTLQLRGRSCTVLGGGPLAAEKARGLVAAGARVAIVAATPDPELEALEAGGVLRIIRRDYAAGDLSGSFLAIDASGDDETNRRSFAEAEERGVLINVVDRPERCHFHAPALVRRGRLNVAISTGGESPFLAGALRARLERILGEEWGPFTAVVGGVRRRLRARGVPIDEQNRVYRRLLRSEVRDLLREGREADARDAAAAIETAAGQPRPGRVALVGAGPGDPALLTVAARELLAEADAVFHDALVEPRTLALCGPQARLVDAGKRSGRASADQAWITAQLIEAARAGEDVVRLKGGDPFVFGRGGEELAALRRAGVQVVIVPGVSAALAAPAAAGIPVTLRGVASSLAIVAGSDRDGSSPEWLERIAAAVDTLVVLMPLGNLDDVCARVAVAVGPDRPAALVAAATQSDQEVLRAPIARVAGVARAAGVTSPATLVVGEVVDAMPARAMGELAGSAGRGPRAGGDRVAAAGLGPRGGELVAGAGVCPGIQEVGR
jgi:uroporphyrin-III C-methyltransferase/precorrin-2 dehydrogenase/sirohydrochlorin ferrochelatase